MERKIKFVCFVAKDFFDCVINVTEEETIIITAFVTNLLLLAVKDTTDFAQNGAKRQSGE